MDDIPDELLLHIVGQLRGPTSWTEPADDGRMPALAALCRVSKKLNSIARPLLYESIDRPPADIKLKWSWKFLKHVLSQPDIRQKQPAMKSLVHWPKFEGNEEKRFLELWILTGLDAKSSRLCQQRFANREDVFFTLAAFWLPNLERIWIRLPSCNVIGGTYLLLEGIGAMPPFLTDENDSIVYNVPWRWPIPSSPISKLSLIRPYVSENMVKKVIRACKALQQFECTLPTPHRPGDRWFGSIVSALNDHSESLEDLSVACRVVYGASPAKYRLAQLEPLSNLTNLKSIRVPLYLVSDPDRSERSVLQFFPQSIEHVHIEWLRALNVRADKQLPGILAMRKAGYFTSLRHVYVTWVHFREHGDEEYDLLENLRLLLHIREQYESSSIKFDILFVLEDDKKSNIKWPKIAEMKELIMDGTYLQTRKGHSDPSVFVRFTTCPGRYTAEEQEDDRDRGYVWVPR
ncbi:hypothetical protein AALT_g9421 [Alternaria alternata]|nr:hypothetical protein AALT_g9421 [Alternaria alternata]